MIATTIACAAMLANICLHNAQTINIADSGLSASATVTGKGFKAEIIYRPDSFSTPDWSRMNDACWNGQCIAYHKWCRPDGEKKFCRYSFSEPGDLYNTVIELTADDQKDLNSAATEIGIVTRTGWMAVEITLNRLDVEASSEDAPSCKIRQPKSSCWPAPRRR